LPRFWLKESAPAWELFPPGEPWLAPAARRSLWSEFKALWHIVTQWITPLIRLADLEARWGRIREKLRQPPRKKLMQMEAFVIQETS